MLTDAAPYCRHCLSPLASHADGVCEDSETTFTFLPLGLRVPVYDVPDSWGDGLFLFYIEDCFCPALFLARGQTFQDAYDWTLEHWADRGMIEDQTDELRADGLTADDEIPPGYDVIDGHAGIFYTENVNGRHLAGVNRG